MTMCMCTNHCEVHRSEVNQVLFFEFVSVCIDMLKSGRTLRTHLNLFPFFILVKKVNTKHLFLYCLFFSLHFHLSVLLQTQKQTQTQNKFTFRSPPLPLVGLCSFL